MIAAITVEQEARMERNRRASCTRLSRWAQTQAAGGRRGAETGAAGRQKQPHAAVSADGETRGGRDDCEDGNEPPEEAEHLDAG